MLRLLFLFALLLAGCTARQPGTTPLAARSEQKGSLYTIPGGFLEIAREGALTQLAIYDDTLGFRSASAAPVYGLNPLDIAVAPPPFAPDVAYMLAAPFGRTSLYTIRLDATPSIAPFWETQLPPLRRIIYTGDADGDGTGEIAMIGDSAFAVLGMNGEERHVLYGDFVDGVVRTQSPSAFILAVRSGSTLQLQMIDPTTGKTIAPPLSLAGGTDVIMSLDEHSEDSPLVVAVSGTPATAYLIDPRTFTLRHDPVPLPAMPIAVLAVSNDGKNGPAAIFNNYPEPGYLPLPSSDTPVPIDYDLQSVPRTAIRSSHLIALAAQDSLAFFDSNFRPLGIAPSPGVVKARIQEIDSLHVLVASSTGGRIYTVDSTGFNWLERHWQLLAIGAGLLILIAIALIAARRYRFIRTIYNNLVRVPNSQGVLVLSPSQRVRHLNMSARSLLDIAPIIPLRRHISEYLVSDETRPVISAMRRLFAQGEEFETRIDVERNGEPRALTFRGRPLIGDYGFTAGYLLLVNDITQTLERERLVNWASVAHHIAHEMKTPLGTVTMTAEMLHGRLSENGRAGSDQLRATSRIIKQTERLRQIVEDLLTVARTESLQRQMADVSLIVSSLAHDYQEIIPPSVELRLVIDGERFRASVDVGQLTVALRNLIDNAWQAIGNREGGTVTIGVKETSEEIRITVQDNGRGMSQQTLTKLFQPFYTEREGGSGIGTVIVKRVIEGHGGTVNVDSAQGRGTRFVLTIPR